jgi:hypothetical protein
MPVRHKALGATSEGGPDTEAVGVASTNRRRTIVERVVIAALVALALFLLVQGCSENKVVRENGFPNGLEAVAPAPLAATVPSQSTVSADLAFGNTGVLNIAGIEIPLDQLDYERATGMLSFTPGPDREYKKLPGSDVRAIVIFWPESGTREADAHEYSWTFKVS